MHPKPRAYEPRRLMAAIRAHARVLLAVAFVALFGGAAVARWALPDVQRAQARVRLSHEPHAVLSRRNDGALLAAAAARAGEAEPVSALQRRITLGFRDRDQLSIEVRGDRAEPAAALANALAEGYAALANARAEAEREDRVRTRQKALAAARAERDESETGLREALSEYGVEDLDRPRAQLRSQLEELDAALQAATLRAPAKRARSSGPRDPAELLEAQRALSRALAAGQGDAEVNALRARIGALQRASSEGGARDTPRTRGLEARIEAKRAELEELEELAASVTPERTQLAQAAARVSQLEAELAALGPAPRSEVTQRAVVEPASRRGLRAAASLLAPAIALALLLGFILLRELRDLRVCEPTELAHWLAVPVLTSSSWPRRSEALEPLVDALADPALQSLGTTLVLPLSELERPLAHTLCAQLNARAQRHYRSLTGSRVTIAQDWQGELDSTRIARAASVADRVLWVVAADTHAGSVLAARRSMVANKERAAAVLVDAEPGLVRSVGSTGDFWGARSEAPEPAPAAPLEAPAH